jgi:hypothetical protein
MIRRGIEELVLFPFLVELSLEIPVELSPMALHDSFSGQTLVTFTINADCRTGRNTICILQLILSDCKY